MEVVAKKCPNCGAQVNLDCNVDVGKCIYCGSKIYVKREGESADTGAEFAQVNAPDMQGVPPQPTIINIPPPPPPPPAKKKSGVTGCFTAIGVIVVVMIVIGVIGALLADEFNIDYDDDPTPQVTRSNNNNNNDNDTTGDSDNSGDSGNESSRLNPFALGETGTFNGMESWVNKFTVELKVEEVVRGDKAWEIVKEGNQFNSEAGDGKEYMLVKFTVKAVESTDDSKININNSLFTFVSKDGTTYNDFVSVSGLPQSFSDIYEGGETTGYAYQKVDIGDEPVIVFLEYENNNVWFSTSD